MFKQKNKHINNIIYFLILIQLIQAQVYVKVPKPTQLKFEAEIHKVVGQFPQHRYETDLIVQCPQGTIENIESLLELQVYGDIQNITINLYGNYQLEDISFFEKEWLNKQNNIIKLTLNFGEDSSLNDISFIEQLQKIPNLEILNLNFNNNEIVSLQPLVAGIGNMKKIKRIKLNFLRNKLEDISVLQEAIAKQSTLQTLELYLTEECTDFICSYSDSRFTMFFQQSCSLIHCDKSCNTCYQQYDKCSKCRYGFYYFETSKTQCISESECESKSGYYADAGKIPPSCNQCIDYCNECYDEYTCDLCMETYFPVVISNPGEQLQEECDPCIDNCYECVDHKTCLLCEMGYIYNRKFGQCIECVANCEECESISVCHLCNKDYFLSQEKNNCLEECPIDSYYTVERNCVKCQKGEYPVQNEEGGGHCEYCGEECRICYEKQKCEVCENETWYIDSEGSCQEDCPINRGFYIQYDQDGKQCKECLNLCDICQSQDSCQQCQEKSFLRGDKQCYETCNDGEIYDFEKRICISCQEGTYYDKQEKLCKSCQKGCQKCSQLHICQKCKPNLNILADDGSCFINCPSKKYFIDKTGEEKQCRKCSLNCNICNAKNNCIYCDENFYLGYKEKFCHKDCSFEGEQFYEDAQTQECLFCKDGTYKIKDQEEPNVYCAKCGKQCAKCDSEKVCKECEIESHYILNDGSCQKDCPVSNGYYEFEEKDEKVCKQCVIGCQICTNYEFCIKCTDSYFLKQNLCVKTCGNGLFQDIQSRTCQKCQNLCLKCNNKDSCTECKSEGKCVDQCPELEYYENKNICEQCLPNCILCKKLSSCLQCDKNNNYRLYDKYNNNVLKCTDTCNINQGYYLEKITSDYGDDQNCKHCMKNCQVCSNYNTCQLCYENYFQEKKVKEKEFQEQDDDDDDDEQEEEDILDQTNCQKCSEKCFDCQYEKDRCVKCKDNLYLQNFKCVEKCDEGYVLKDKICYLIVKKSTSWWMYLIISLSISCILLFIAFLIKRYWRTKQDDEDYYKRRDSQQFQYNVTLSNYEQDTIQQQDTSQDQYSQKSSQEEENLKQIKQHLEKTIN